MPKLKLIFGTYNSVPVGMRDEEIEAVYQKAFKPFISILYNHPEAACTLYYSGTLLSWLDKRHSEFNDVLAELTARKQVELLGGAFYDPILTVIPRSDRLGQIESLTTYLRKRFGRRPRGGWITEAEWEPTLASTLNTCGIDFVFLGERHFRSAELAGKDLFIPCVTEDQGKTLTVFPCADELSDAFASLTPEKAVSRLKVFPADNEEVLAVLLIDGRKLNGGFDLERFFTLLAKAEDWIESIHPGRYLRQFSPRKKVYFPCASREYLARAALSPKSRKYYVEAGKALESLGKGDSRMLQGGSFRNFFSRFPESNLLYAKMQYTHILVNQIKGDKYRKSSALEELWKGQCGSPYWPDPEGGIFDSRLRKAAYRSLISAEKVTREKGVFIPSIVTADFDMDNRIEYLYQGNDMNAYVHAFGGRVFELDYLPVSWNYLDTFSPNRETEGPDDPPRYVRDAFLDRFFKTGGKPGDSWSSADGDIGGFGDLPYEVIKCDREHSELVLEGSGIIETAEGNASVRIVKKYIFKRSTINLYYSIKNLSDKILDLVFGSEVNLSFAGKDVDCLRFFQLEGKDRRILSPERLELPSVTELLFEDVTNETDVHFSSLEPARVLCMPVETTNADGEKRYQATCLMPRWPLALPPQGTWENRLSLRIDGK